MTYTAILLAAGVGRRMDLGFNKVFLTIKDMPLLILSATHFFNDANCSQLIIVTKPGGEDADVLQLLKQYELYDSRIVIVDGGTERQYSVENGLKHVNQELVLIHDAARPFITHNMINELVRVASDVGCAIPAVPVKDTIKVVDSHDTVLDTLPRDTLFAVQTPQACITQKIRLAHDYALRDSFLGTDDASIIEKYRICPVKVVKGSYDNIKVTTKEDIVLAFQLFDEYFKK